VIVRQQQIDLATCRQLNPGVSSPDVRKGGATVRSQSILFKGKVLVTVSRSRGPIELEGVSPDRGWVLYAIDPMGSASLAADGLTLRAVRVTGGRSYTVASGLLYGDYRAWCGGRLVMTVGGDRISTHNKWLIATGPPTWRARVLVRDSHVAFGSLACDGNGVAGSTVYFVRRGWLYAFHVGRLLKLPPTTGYYGHTAWPYSVRR
jgi:hypothetical protein